MDSESKIPFLAPSPSPSEHLPFHESRRRDATDHSQCWSAQLTKCLIAILFVLYVPLCVAFVWLSFRLQPQSAPYTIPDLLPSPARESGAISYEVRKLNVDIYNNPFSGPPRPESDKAWHNLIEHSNIYISKEEVKKAGIETLELADESGFVVIPSLQHQLHCLKRIRRWAYRDHYYHDASAETIKEASAHVDHCVEVLRQQVICHGDLAFSSLYYLNGADGSSPTAEDFSLHQCVNWPKLRNWMVERSVDITEPGLLKPPK